MPDLDCRLAKLEQRVDNLAIDVTDDKLENKELMRGIFEKLNSIIDTQSKQRGFWAGIVFAVSGVVTIIGVSASVLSGKWPS